jgi:hypothetical protein
LVSLALGLAALGCAAPSGEESPASNTDSVEDALARARSSADRLGKGLMKALGEQLESAGPAAAISVCSEIAPAMASEISRDGVEIRRTSLRTRNSANAPDDWERAGLGRLEEMHAAGELPQEISEVDKTSGDLRYLRSIVVAPQCLQCHGADDELDSGVREQVTLRYPEDLATGFAAGDLRGAFSVRVRMAASAPN